MTANDVQMNVIYGYAEAAAPTHQGRCSDCPNKVDPLWDLVSPDGNITGTIGGQCQSCGQLGKGWVHTGARKLPADPQDHEEFLDALKREAEARQAEEWATLRSAIRADLIDRLKAAVKAMPEPDSCDWEDWTSWHDVSTSDGGDGPIYLLDGQLSAWAPDPADHGDGIFVVLDDITGEESS